ncbi:S-layer homology domain-containing protein [Fusibacter paucivorans]|uniref:S-layer homology domain-containing protein n=1 Tax=Fusibacter paucivorans TaxID=76009 RepID=A0ABS5PN83_9FIRM|nr:S-layer homology domain-containing protein [Fusibacter paucivorans]MBS7526618.1 S-layer homology domain-containing protein [Fusibacter paucivorans]
MKKFFSLLLAFSLILSSFTMPVFADTASGDDLSGHWAESVMRPWVEDGLLGGYGNGAYLPNATITRAEFCALLDNIVQIPEGTDSVSFSDVPKDQWYHDVVTKAASYGLISGSYGNFTPDQPISREAAAVIVEKLLNAQESELASIDNFKDGASVSTWAEEALNAMLQKGYLSGYPDGTIGAGKSITRAEAVVMLNKAFGTIINTAGTYTQENGVYAGNVTIASSDVILKDAVVKGDLYIAEAVGDGDVTLEGVTIEGDIIVKGGGENSIHFNNINVYGALIVKKVDNKVRIVASGTTKVNVTYLESGGLLIEDSLAAEGFGSVVLSAEDLKDMNVELVGNFDSVDVKSEGFAVNLGEKTVVNKLTVSEKATAFKLAGKGTVKAAEVNASNTKLDVVIDKVNVGEKAEGVTANGKDVNAGFEGQVDEDGPQDNNTPAGGSTGGSSGGGSGGNTETPVAVLTLSDSSVHMTTNDHVEITATVQYTTSSLTKANIVWASSDPSVVSVSKNGTEISNAAGVYKGTNTIAAFTTSEGVKVGVYVVKDPDAADPLASANVYTMKEIAVKVSLTTATMYDVTFEVKDGDTTTMPKQSIPEGKAAVEPTAPTQAGYTFLGWYLNDVKYDFSKPVTGDMTLKAKWEVATVKYVDSRFDAGYPTIAVNDKGYITVTLKLKETPTTKVTAYMIADPHNAHMLPDVAAVTHGHTGSGDSVVWASYNGYYEITDSASHTITTTAKLNDEKAIAAIVLSDGTTVSTEPTIVEIKEDVSDELDTTPPRVASIYVNNDRTKLYIYTDDELDGNSSASASDFTLTNKGKPVVITAVDVIEDAIQYYDAIELTVSGLSASDFAKDLKLSYTGSTITDRAQTPNKFEIFTIKDVEDSVPVIKDVFVASDLSVLGFTMTPGIETDDESSDYYTIKAYYASDYASILPGSELSISEDDIGFNMDDINFVYDIDTSLTPMTGYEIYVVATVTTIAGDRSDANSSAIIPKILSAPTMTKADYDSSYDEISIQYSGILDDSVMGCNYDLKITDSSDNVIATSSLRGEAWAYYHTNSDNSYTGTSEVVFDNNFFYGTLPPPTSGMKVYIRYNPKHQGGYLQDVAGNEVIAPTDWMLMSLY